MTRRSPRVLRRVCAALPLLLCGGCGPDPYSDYVRDSAPAEAPPPAPILDDANEETTAIRLVQQSSAPDGPGTCEDWVQRHLEQLLGNVMFPRWQTQRRAASKYEVTFTYTLVSESNEIRHGGFAWNADLLLRLVSPMREMTDEELTPRAARVYQNRQFDRQRVELEPE